MTKHQRAQSHRSHYTLSAHYLHELRTPLNQIIGYSELLAEQAQEAGQVSYVLDLQKIQSAGRQLLTLLNHGVQPHVDTASIAHEPRTVQLPNILRPDTATEAVDETTPALILVVDDNPQNRDMLSRRLERQGYAVATAENGREALEAVRAQAFDMVLLDIMMPEMDGYTVLQQVKADEALHDIPIIMISAVDEMASIVRCIEGGAEDYLLKPFDPVLLKARIGACLEKKRAHDNERRLFEQCQLNYVRLQELEKLRDDLTHMIIHDLRTPLTSVISGLQIMETLGDMNGDQKEIMSIALGGGETLLSMINDLLDISKMESGALQLDCAMLSAADLILSAVDQVARLAQSNGLTLVQQIATDLPRFEGDENKLRRALVNLLGNAIKFTPSRGTVTIAAQQEADGRSLLFSVSDTGEGIPSEAFEHIFEKFGQVDSRQGGRRMSTGLGLTFCKMAVEAHNGNIRVESVTGKGSTFSFTIPMPTGACIGHEEEGHFVHPSPV